MSKQTAVEWLVEQLKEYDFADIKDDENYVLKIPAWILTEKEEQAKAMEKEQIIEAYLTPLSNEYWFQKDEILNQESEKYYNETYNDKTIESYE